MDPELQGRVALVTGAGRRVGRAIALDLGAAGADVVVHVNRSRGPGEEVAQELRALGVRAVVVAADQRDVDAIRAACAAAEQALGPVDLLVNSAATWPHADLASLTPEDFDEALEVNLRGPFFWALTLGRAMAARDGGAIVSLADVTTDRPDPAALPYALAKSGVVSMTYGLAKALAPKVRVNAIGPGPILFPEGYPEARAAADRAATLRGVEGRPEDVAAAVRYLAAAPNVTGVLLPVDGGYRFGS